MKTLVPLTLGEIAWAVREKDPGAWKRMGSEDRQKLIDKVNAERDRLVQLARWPLPASERKTE